MPKLLLLIVLLVTFVIVWSKYQRGDLEEKRRLVRQSFKYIFWGILIILIMMGRLHWLGGLVAAGIPFLPLLLQKLLGKFRQHNNTHQDQSDVPQTHAPLTSVEEAMEILGLTGDINSGNITAEMIQDAHRKLIQKLHPDRGGNDYLAAKINQARDLLLAKINQ